MPDKNTIGKSQSVGETIYQLLRKSILTLKLDPGTFMSEKEIAEELQVSRTPVREAFIKLSREGLINIYPQKGTYVSKINLTQASEERFLRESLESAVIGVLMRENTEECVLRLNRNLEKQKNAIATHDLPRFMELDDMFHGIIFEETQKTFCYSIILNMLNNYRRLRFLSMYVEDVVNFNYEQHLAITQAIASGDEQAAKACMMGHLRRLITEKDEISEKYPDYFETAGGSSVNFGLGKLGQSGNLLTNMLSDNQEA